MSESGIGKSLDDVIKSQQKQKAFQKGKFRRGFNKNRRGQFRKNYRGAPAEKSLRIRNTNFRKKYIKPYNARRQKIIYIKKEPTKMQIDDDLEKQSKQLLKISNLAPKTTNDDIFKLFSSIGQLKRCGIRYDTLGKSMVL